MITEYDLQEAIAECQGQRNPNASTCIKLASYLTIQRELYGKASETPAYSFSSGDDYQSSSVVYDGGSEFAERINGMEQQYVLGVMDELMDLLRVLYPKIYDSVMRKLV